VDDGTSPILVATSPAVADPGIGGQQQFTAKVLNASSQAVTWSIDPPVGSIDQTGLYTAPEAEGSIANVIVKACSQADRCGIAVVTLPTVPFGALASVVNQVVLQ
jgi:hypothetical protein